MKQKANFLIFCMIFAVNAANCQKLSALDVPKTLHFNTKKPVNKLFTLPATPTLPLHPLLVSSTKPLLSPGFYAVNPGFFCKQEIKLEKAIKVPFKFRLGSVQQCDAMEGKRH